MITTHFDTLIWLPTRCSSGRQQHELLYCICHLHVQSHTVLPITAQAMEGQFGWWAWFSSSVRPPKLIILIVPSVDVKFNKSGRDHFELIVNRCHCLAVYMTARRELMYCIRQSVYVCMCVCILGWGGGSSLSWLEKWFAWKCGTWGEKNCLPCPPSVFYITLLVVHSKSVSSHLYRYVQLLTGHEFLIVAGKWGGKDEKPSSPYFSHGCTQLITLW